MFKAPNPPLHSDPACIAFRSLSASRFLGFVHRLGAGVAGELLPLGSPIGVVSMDIDEETIQTLVSACEIDLVLGEISYFLQTMIADAKSEGKTPYLKNEFIDGWMAFKEAQDRQSLLHFIHNAPEYAPMILQYVRDCCPGGRAYNESEINKLLNRDVPSA